MGGWFEGEKATLRSDAGHFRQKNCVSHKFSTNNLFSCPPIFIFQLFLCFVVKKSRLSSPERITTWETWIWIFFAKLYDPGCCLVERNGLVFLENTPAHFLALPSLNTPDPLVSFKIRNFSIMSYFFLSPVETQSNSFTLTACSQQKEIKGTKKGKRQRQKRPFFTLLTEEERKRRYMNGRLLWISGF